MFNKFSISAEISKEIFDAFFERKLQNFNGLEAKEVAAIKYMISVVKSLYQNNFKNDW